tara:strand:- start:1130 stop:1405 length:276 start_codon:yes stop_codon:yes gene_type:complete
MDTDAKIVRIFNRMNEMQAEIDFLKSLVCNLEPDTLCNCEKCWCDRKYKELGGQEFDLDWKIRDIKNQIAKLWKNEKIFRFEKYVDIGLGN